MGDNMVKICILHEEMVCIECGECLICDLDPKKTCDNCSSCMDMEYDYKIMEIDDIEK